jgi:hypothetical protein
VDGPAPVDNNLALEDALALARSQAAPRDLLQDKCRTSLMCDHRAARDDPARFPHRDRATWRAQWPVVSPEARPPSFSAATAGVHQHCLRRAAQARALASGLVLVSAQVLVNDPESASERTSCRLIA